MDKISRSIRLGVPAAETVIPYFEDSDITRYERIKNPGQFIDDVVSDVVLRTERVGENYRTLIFKPSPEELDKRTYSPNRSEILFTLNRERISQDGVLEDIESIFTRSANGHKALLNYLHSLVQEEEPKKR